MTNNHDLVISKDANHNATLYEAPCATCGTLFADQRQEPHPQSLTPLSIPSKLLLTVEEAAQQLSVGRPKMYELVMRGEVLSVKIGASRRIPTQAVEEYVVRLSQEAVASQTRLAERGR